MNEIKKGEYYKHFKGKNIYKILACNVIYTGTKVQEELNNLVVYQNIKDGKIFVREADELLQELEEEKQIQYGQKYRIEKISEDEAKEVIKELEEER